MAPIVLIRERELEELFKRGQSERRGVAVGLDNDSVIHVRVGQPSSGPRLHEFPVEFRLYDSSFAIAHFGSSTTISETRCLYVAVARAPKGFVCEATFAPGGQTPLPCEVRTVPDGSELYSRSKGLLETGVLSKKSVGIVGLGSGGAPIALELAKASVGRFVLIDFDRLELSNVSRHVCGLGDLGRLKTLAVRDALLDKNPSALIETLEIDVNEQSADCAQALSKVDLIVCASDNDRSRFLLNEIALKYRITSIFGRAITRAAGGDVLRVRPFIGPCYSCLYSLNVRQEGGDDEEVSQQSQARKLLPEYTSDQDIEAVIQVGLSSDIAPISNFMVKLSLVELSRGLPSGISSLEEDFAADFYIWANRRDAAYSSWAKLGFGFNQPAILRWYGARIERDPNCMVCGLNP